MLSFCALPQTVSEQSMKFIHQREHLNEDDIVVIECSQTCNIRLMNDAFSSEDRRAKLGFLEHHPGHRHSAPDQRDAQTEPHLFHQGHSTVGVAFIDAAPARNHPAGAKI